MKICGRPDSSKGSNYRITGKFSNTMLKSVEDPTTLSSQTTELQADFQTISWNLWKTRQLWGLKLQNYSLIFIHYIKICGRHVSSCISNYRTTGWFWNIILKSVEDPIALRPQTSPNNSQVHLGRHKLFKNSKTCVSNTDFFLISTTVLEMLI